MSIEISTEFDAALARAGLSVPPERRETLLASYITFRKLAETLREAGLTPADEPANIYGFGPIVRAAAHPGETKA